jgi:hypothetical protein
MAARMEELTRFVRDCLSRQIPRGEVEAALLGAGWHPQQVRRALDTYADSAFPVPVPRPVAYVSAGEAFLYLVLFSALGISAGSLVQLLFTLIEWAFYDPSSSTFVYGGWQSGVRWAIARLVIALPVFLLASYWAVRAIRTDPSQASSPVRRWLTYIAMFVAVGIIIADLVTLIAYLLSGETTVRFLLKVVTVALVAGGVLFHYLRDLQAERESPPRPSAARPILAAFLLASLLAAGGGLWLVGSPAEQATQRIDERRVQDLRTIAQAVDLHRDRHARLPPDLASLVIALGTQLPVADPETGRPYAYRVRDAQRFELCADFARPSGDRLQDAIWTHGGGRQCFALTAGEENRR